MKYPFRFLLPIVCCLAFAAEGVAAIVFKPGEKAKFVAPGEEEINGTAQEIFAIAQAGERKGNTKRAIKAYRAIVRKFPKDTLAGGAAYRAAELQEQSGLYLRAAESYRWVVEKYPRNPNFNEAIEAQFRIGEMYLAGKKVKVFGIPLKTSMEKAVEIFAAVVRTAPYGKYTARAQFDIGLAREKQKMNDLAVAAYQAVVDKFPSDPIAADAQYQIGYLWFTAARDGTEDLNAAARAETAFQDFLFRHPRSEKAAQARENLARLDRKQTNSAFEIAKFYDKKKNYRAAVIYYNDVIRQQPGSTQGDRAKRRIDELRAKVGDAELQPRALSLATAEKPVKKTSTVQARSASGEEPAMRTSPSDVAPLPPPEADASLPPPASLTPDTTTAPEASPTPEATASPEQ